LCTGGLERLEDGIRTFSSGGSSMLSGSSSSASCTADSSPSAIGSGTHTITASYSGDANHDPSQGPPQLTVISRINGSPQVRIDTPANDAYFCSGSTIRVNDGRQAVARQTSPLEGEAHDHPIRQDRRELDAHVQHKAQEAQALTAAACQPPPLGYCLAASAT
jgi:hypothetical protein